jgi:hypothetical protein
VKEVYINPFTDFGFKKLFGEDANKRLLIDFLNSLLPDHHQIADLHYINRTGRTALDRKAIFDLACTSTGASALLSKCKKPSKTISRIAACFTLHSRFRSRLKKGMGF